MLRSFAQRLRRFLRSELDLQKDRLVPEITASLMPQLISSINMAARAESRFTELGWKTRVAGGKTYVTGLEFTFDNVAHAHILQDLEFLAVLVRDLNAKVRLLRDGRVEIQIGNVRVVPETPQEGGILVEVFRDEIYFVESRSPMFVWDVGANVGTASLYFADVLGWEVAAYELFPKTAQSAKDNISRSGLSDRISLTVAGVGGKNQTLTLPYYSETRGSNGLYENDTKAADATSVPVEVEVRDAVEVLGEVLSKADGRPVIAKLDCEGAEYDIIERLSDAKKLRSLSAIVMEVHAYPGLDPSRVISCLLDAGFLIRRSRRSSSHLHIVYATRLESC